jgi:hypothetical protein
MAEGLAAELHSEGVLKTAELKDVTLKERADL